MASTRRPLYSDSKLKSKLNSDIPLCDTRTKKPLPEPTTVKQVLLMMVLHVCRRTVFVNTNLKVAVYGGSLFIISLLADVLPIPRTYFARSDNFMNQYFVKFGWFWTLILIAPFIVLTSYTYCCGKRDKIIEHSIRLGIATTAWYIWTTIFSYIEVNYGWCSAASKTYQIKLNVIHQKDACLQNGHVWRGFDISGHAFILIYSTLVLIEESRAINGWEGIRDLIRNEDHARSIGVASTTNSPLRFLSKDEFSVLKTSYIKFTPYVRSLFIAITILSIMWDVMLVSTMLYYHVMIEKMISGAIAIFTWFITYRYWYTIPKILPNMPGEGLFRYKDTRPFREMPLKLKRTAPTTVRGELPKFMGMPLYGLRNEEIKQEKDDTDGNETDGVSNTINKV